MKELNMEKILKKTQRQINIKIFKLLRIIGVGLMIGSSIYMCEKAGTSMTLLESLSVIFIVTMAALMMAVILEIFVVNMGCDENDVY